MKIILAQPRGFCAGVERAIESVESALEQFGAPVYVLHEIVHNRHVVRSLEGKGARFVERLDEVPAGAVLLFSAHGVAQRVEDQAAEAGLRAFNATCPLVLKVRRQGRQYAAKGYRIILIGDIDHQEVIGTVGQIPAPVTVLRKVEEVGALPFAADTPLAYITQTTLSMDDTRVVVAALRQRYPQIVGPDTRNICYAVQNRQLAVRSLSRQVQLVLVVGGHNSANSETLRWVAECEGIPSYRLANGSELRREWFDGISTVGLSAGASTPEAMIDDVLDRIGQWMPVEIGLQPGIEEYAQFQLPAGLIARQ
ncbi:4-hydroxy-3-methylbut-2-enyl diphosphate reductase [Pseudomonas paraeruginosa]|uniref:4-hydroxy-3-methylbut-2-enyl diphosphate reductase n=1 Tax=Pseudomonas aeruginosa TaxID=287 RepID=UPI0021F8A4BE|nr:4-hydroxy-3-methylbut-2-enyl diphosphate reductase [Pseudomonas aeruginosa]UYT20806.1 4-hydroxy-3-methylbut-2-enyl diphosphate reductase [Pseudomonas aeruginosa]